MGKGGCSKSEEGKVVASQAARALLKGSQEIAVEIKPSIYTWTRVSALCPRAFTLK